MPHRELNEKTIRESFGQCVDDPDYAKVYARSPIVRYMCWEKSELTEDLSKCRYVDGIDGPHFIIPMHIVEHVVHVLMTCFVKK